MNRLRGKRVVVTRAAHQAGELADKLRERGATPLLYPCIAIVPLLNDNLPDLSAFDWLVVTSSNTVEALRGQLDFAGYAALKIAAVGTSTAAALRDAFAVAVDFIPDVQTGEHLAETLPLQRDERVLVPGSAIAKPDLTRILTGRGADVTAVSVYQTIVGTGGEAIPAMLQAGEVDALTFTSSSTVTHFVGRVGTVPDVPAVCIGTVTAQTAIDAGFKRVIVPETYTLDGLIAVMESEL
ncbi:MAG: uroporphyrinogen-III synthase [Anaerolineaceae bacterium]|nr:MAG: uroporphyrinogen-III synthase [Anaerolineaceae bacterium]